MNLRKYQIDAVAQVRQAISDGAMRIILQAETGAGKTVMAAAMLAGVWAKGKRGLFIARNRMLVTQASNQLAEWNVPHGIMMAGKYLEPQPIMICSKDTYLSWVVNRQIISMPAADIVIPDECHETGSSKWKALLEKYDRSVWVGLTATPARPNGKGLGHLYSHLIQAAPPSELIDQGYIVPTKVFAPYRPDLKGVGTGHNGDYAKGELAKRMDRPTLVGDIVKHWKQLGEDRPTICFTCSIDHCMHVRDSFTAAGIPCGHIDSRTMDQDEVQYTMDAFQNQRIRVICNVGMLTQGVDLPLASCGILARPTRSYVLFRQMVGRLKRPYPGKQYCILLDHAGAVYFHGMPDDDVEWTLDPDTKVTKTNTRGPDGKPPLEAVACSRCYALYRGPECPNCGHRPHKKGKVIESGAGTLVPVGESFAAWEWEEKIRGWHRALAIAANKGRTFAAAASIFHEKFGEWPSCNLPNYPDRVLWSRPVKEVFPQYCRTREKL